MTYAASVAIAADRYTPCVRTITFRGLDLTGVALRMQARLRGDTPGQPLFDLQIVGNTQAQGLKLVSVDLTDGYPVSVVQIRINETTIESLPYAGELGDATTIFYDLQGTLAGDKRVLMAGTFLIAAGVTGADNAPLNRPFGFGGHGASATGMRSGATLTFGETRIDITIDGADLIAPLAQRATDAADRADADRVAAELAADTALASSHYYPTRAAGEAATAVDGLFTTDDGAGQIIFYRRSGAGSVELSRAVTAAALALRTVRHISEFGVVPNAPYDQSDAILRACGLATAAGVMLMTKQGETYRHAKSMHLPSGVVWQMNGATLVATDPLDIALIIGDDTHLLGGCQFLAPNVQGRDASLTASRIVIVGARWTVDRPEVDGSASIGIMKFGCSFGQLIRPVVRNTKADGIHSTYGCHNNTTIDPTVENCADDCIAYVAYTGDGRTIDNELLIGGRGRNGGARGLTVLGARNFLSIGWYAENCSRAGLYTGGEYAGSLEAANTFGSTNVIVESPVVINCPTDPSVGHASFMVFGRDGSNAAQGGDQISRSALSTRLIHPTVGGGPGAAAAVRVDYGAEGCQVLYLKARDVTNTDSAPNLVNVNGHNTTLVQPEGIAIGGNGVLIGPRASGFVVIDRPVMEQMGVDAPATYGAFFACDPAASVTRVDILDARLRSSAGLPNLISGKFPDGSLRMLGSTRDDKPIAEVDPIAERYQPGLRFDFSAGGAPRARPVTVPANAFASFGLAAQILAQIDIVAVLSNDQNVRMLATEVLFYSASDASGAAGVDYVALPGGGYYRRAVIGPAAGAAWGNLGILRKLTVVGGQPVLSVGAAAAIDLTVSAVLSRKMG